MKLLITAEQLTKGSPLGGNIDVDKYASVINETQVFIVEPILGTKLFKKILNDHPNNEGVYLTILEDYVRPILIHSTAAEYISIGTFMVANTGILRYTPQDATPASKEDIDFLASKQRAKADVYIDRLQKFLCDKNAEIPEYSFAQDNSFDTKPDKDIDTFGGWHLSGYNYGHSNAMIDIFKNIFDENGGKR